MYRKTLIIGQAPASQSQKYPYDTTQLYDWLQEVGVSKEEAQDLFIFDAVYDKFPGFDVKGGHLKPTKIQMDDYWERELRDKVWMASKILLLGNVARDYIHSKINVRNKKVYCLIHPSSRNIGIYRQNKEKILSVLKEIVKR